jgi:hypothetical protein
VESFNGKLRDELINREVFTTLLETKILIENWRRDYNKVRPHSSLGYRPPAPEAIQPALTPAPLTQKVVSSLGAGQSLCARVSASRLSYVVHARSAAAQPLIQ